MEQRQGLPGAAGRQDQPSDVGTITAAVAGPPAAAAPGSCGEFAPQHPATDLGATCGGERPNATRHATHKDEAPQKRRELAIYWLRSTDRLSVFVDFAMQHAWEMCVAAHIGNGTRERLMD